jgi:hypothetical protein
MTLTAAGIRPPDDPARVVYAIGFARAASEGTKVFHLTVLMEEGMDGPTAVINSVRTYPITCYPYHLARVIYAMGCAVGWIDVAPRKGTEVLYL